MRHEESPITAPLPSGDPTPFLRRQMRRLSYEIQYEIRGLINQYPSLYLPISRWRHGINTSLDPAEIANPEAVSTDTEIVIEAPPRSANTFAVVAFKLAQPRLVRVAHHQHAPAQIIAAAKMNIPALVIIRDPEEVTLSRIASHPPITMKQALRDYIHFYKNILKYRDSFATFTFDIITTDFGSVIREMNNRFGTYFDEFIHNDENVKKCFSIIEERYRKMRRFENITLEKVVARPSDQRKTTKETLRREFLSDHLAYLRSESYRLYEKFTSYASA